MECACLVGSAAFTECEAPSFYVEKVRVARKEHRCTECNEEIKPGTKYHYAKGVWEGSFRSYHTCLVCDNMRRRIFCGGGWVFGELSEALLNEYGFGLTDVPDDWDEENE